MCCRYYIDRDDDELAEIIETAAKSALAEKFMASLSRPMKTDGEIRPTDIVPVIAPGRSVPKAEFTILTREPSAKLAQIHNRMPLILPKDRIDEWIRPDAKPEDLLAFALTDMVMERATESTQTPMPRFWHHHI